MNYSGTVFHIYIGLLITALLFGVGCSSPASLQQNKTAQSTTNPDRFYGKQLFDSEGMWLPSQIEGSVYDEWESRELELSASALYNPDSTSLNQAIVRINTGQNSSGTGSFVSENGLILTNYNVIHNALSAASSTNQDYLANGFYAHSNKQEIPIRNYTLYIPLEQKEVTKQIERRLPDTLAYYERQRRSNNIEQQLITERKDNNEDLVLEINDFWSGNRQFLSVYKVIRDVRLVHAPPESKHHYDNDTTLRHTGNYAFLRAYVSPNGRSSSYDKSNIPLNPQNHFNINSGGVESGDLTLTAGFPGETNRYESSHAMRFYKNIRNPTLTDSYRAILEGLELAAGQNRKTAIRTASKRNSAASNLRYYRGLQQAIEKNGIIKQKSAAEEKFDQWVGQDSLRNIKYRRVLDQLEQAYDIASQSGDLLYALVYPLNNNKLLQIAGLYNSYRQYLNDPDNSDLNKADKDSLLNRHQSLLNTINPEAQNLMLTNMIHTLSSLPDGKVMVHLLVLFGDARGDTLKNNIRSYFDNQKQQSIIYSLDRAEQFLKLPIDSARSRPTDSMVKLYQEMVDTYQFSYKNYSQHITYLKPAQEHFVEGILEFQTDSVVYPDANNTLRLNLGSVQGYNTRKGSYQSPFITSQEIMANQLDKDSSSMLQKLKAPENSSSNTRLVVNFLTTNDITGGSEGSPILDSQGNIVGLVIDRNTEGMGSDLFYNPEKSRSINTDIRYILFVMDNIFNADRLLKEIQP